MDLEKSIVVDENSSTYLNTVGKGTCPDLKKESAIVRFIRQVLVTLGLILGIFISSLSETAISTVANAISKEFNTFGSLTWIAGGYLMTIVAFTPLFGKFSDIFGRKPVGVFAISLFFIGSLGCALSTSINMLICFRVVSGIGGGGLSSLSFIMVSDVIPIAKRPQFLAGISLVFCLSQVLGPILGGIVAEYSWRIIFYLLLPFCILLLGLIIFVLELPKSSGNISQKLKRIDYLGSLTLIFTIVVLILMTTWGGKDYSWTSTPLIILYVLEIISFSLFIIIQWKFSKEPILPSRVFNRNIICANIANFCCGAINLTTVFYLPVYYLTVKNLSPSQAGYELIPLLISNSLFCLFSAYFTRWFKTIRGVMWVGAVILIVGVILLCFIRIGASEGENISYVIILGIGLGMNLQLLMLISQISVDQEDAAISTSFNMFTTYIGGVIGVAVTGSVYNNVFVEQLKMKLPELDAHDLARQSVVNSLSSESLELLNLCYYEAFRYGMMCLIPFSIICLLSLLGLKKIQLPENEEK